MNTGSREKPLSIDEFIDEVSKIQSGPSVRFFVETMLSGDFTRLRHHPMLRGKKLSFTGQEDWNYMIFEVSRRSQIHEEDDTVR